jgi:SAM-dependent methyltransferase
MLDLACGTGIVLREFLNDVNKIVGLDASWSMLEFQRKSNNTINDTRLVMADGNCTPFSQGVFDVVILGHAIHWFNLELLLPEIHRLLKPGGWLVVISRYPSPSTPYRPLCHYILEKFKNKNTQSACLVDLNDIGSGHIVGIEKFGFSKYSRVVIESEDIIPVKTYVERVSDNDIYWTLVDDEKRNLLKELEDALFELSENGIIHEMNFDYILTAQKNTPY